MAHIASCIAHVEPASISRLAPPPPHVLSSTSPASTPEKEKPFTWRMLPSDHQRKYQLFPKEKQLPALATGKALDPEKAFAVAMGQSGDKGDKSGAGLGLRLRINQHSQHGSSRRHKVSIPDLGHMTTVQEVSMDSPTIPGRPPVHERSASFPKETADLARPAPRAKDDGVSRLLLNAGRPGSPRHLAPLVIPDPGSSAPAPLLKSKISAAKLRSDSSPPMDSSRSARMDLSPMSRTHFTPSASTPDLTYPRSATTDASSFTTLPTPVSAPLMEFLRASPNPWEGSTGPEDFARRSGHRRGASESSSIMDRGRPRKRNDAANAAGPSPKYNDANLAKSSERRAFEELPRGWKPADTVGKLSVNELASLQSQAYGQAERFEVLRADDVEALSKELRHLDERTEYLRRTYSSLRAGRRNLHTRICQYLRSPRVARFSHESMLKQEEALAELDASIDDWVNKLEKAENRRTRVRQKLLEHVAAATLLPPPAKQAVGASETLQRAMGMRSPAPEDISTPPRSPSRSGFRVRSGSDSPSPQRVVAQLASTVGDKAAVGEAAAAAPEKAQASVTRATSSAAPRRGDVESIRIYAGDDVYALLADVENEFSKMSGGSGGEPAEPTNTTRERQKSREKLSGEPVQQSEPPLTPGPPLPSSLSAAASPGASQRAPSSPVQSPGPSPLSRDRPSQGELLLLTSAVFKP